MALRDQQYAPRPHGNQDNPHSLSVDLPGGSTNVIQLLKLSSHQLGQLMNIGLDHIGSGGYPLLQGLTIHIQNHSGLASLDQGDDLAVYLGADSYRQAAAYGHQIAAGKPL